MVRQLICVLVKVKVPSTAWSMVRPGRLPTRSMVSGAFGPWNLMHVLLTMRTGRMFLFVLVILVAL